MTNKLTYINLNNDYSHRQLRIALTGKMRSGKDTAMRALSDELIKVGFYPNSHSFGDSLKSFAKQLFSEEFEENKKPRDLYQWFGQTLRQRNPNIWVNQTAKAINHANDMATLTDKTHVAHIITDLRQPNEYEWCVNNHFIIIKVDCDDEVRLQRMNALGDNYKLEDLQHETEQYIDSFKTDFYINTTNLDKETLEKTMKSFTRVLLNKYNIRGEF